MGRRFKRFKRMAQQVVEVTRRIWKTCICCGSVREEICKDVVPLARVITGTATKRWRPLTEIHPVGICCDPLIQGCRLRGQSVTEEEGITKRRSDPTGSITFSESEKPGTSEPVLTKSDSKLQKQMNETSADCDAHSACVEHNPPRSIPGESGSSVFSIQMPPESRYGLTNDVLAERPYTGVQYSRVSEEHTPLNTLDSGRSIPRISTVFHDPHSGHVSLLDLAENVDTHPSCSDFQSVPSLKLLESPVLSNDCRLALDLSGLDSPRDVSPPYFNQEFACDDFWYGIRPSDWLVQLNISRNSRSQVDIITFPNLPCRATALKTLASKNSVKEANILIECQSPFVLKLCASFVRGDDRFLCMDYYKHKDLAHWLKKDNPRTYFREQEAIWICAYVLSGLDFLHSKCVLHLDVKPGNIFIDEKGYPVLGDFGSALRMADLKGFTGCPNITPAYTCPEVLACQKPSKLSDLWSVTCVFYETIAGKSAWQGQNQAEIELRVSLAVPPDVSMLSATAQDFVLSQLRPTPRERLGFSSGAREVMRHQMFRDVNWERVKYGHRYDNSLLLETLNNLGLEDEMLLGTMPAAPDLGSISSQKSYPWELWSSSSEELSDDEFGFSACLKRELYAVLEEDEGDEDEANGDEDPEVQEFNSNESQICHEIT